MNIDIFKGIPINMRGGLYIYKRWPNTEVKFAILLTTIMVLCTMGDSYPVFSRESVSNWDSSGICILRPLISIFN